MLLVILNQHRQGCSDSYLLNLPRSFFGDAIFNYDNHRKNNLYNLYLYKIKDK